MQQAIPYKAWTTLPSARSQPLNNHDAAPKPPVQFDGSMIRSKEPAKQFDGSMIRDNTPAKGHVREAVSENAVIILARRGCCMSHVVKRLLNGHGVNPAVFEFEEEDENDVVKELEMIGTENDGNDESRVQFPAVFIGGRLFGGLDRVMATHITGELIPVLKQAGALWL